MRTASVNFEVAVQSAYQGEFSYITAVRGQLDGRLVIEHRVRIFVLVNEMGHGVMIIKIMENHEPESYSFVIFHSAISNSPQLHALKLAFNVTCHVWLIIRALCFGHSFIRSKSKYLCTR